MNREEAIKRIDRLAQIISEEYYDHLSNGGTKNSDCEDDIDALEWVLIALKLEKQTTKCKHINTRYMHWGKCRHDKFRCETCGFTKEFTDNHTAQYKYCPSCGREINWSKPKGDSYDFAIIDEVIAYDTQKED